jgi:hypothetical protein
MANLAAVRNVLVLAAVGKVCVRGYNLHGFPKHSAATPARSHNGHKLEIAEVLSYVCTSCSGATATHAPSTAA